MCMGIPMQVVEMRGSHALCEANGEQQLVDMLLVGEQPAGTWLLNFLGAAREVLHPEQALHMQQALQAVAASMSDTPDIAGIDHLFADLLNREPELPEHLRPLVGQAPIKPTDNV
ncbi:MAG: HypC/HybG/HupF family hydrogenase formation chaperone [Thiolinea sp.]